MSDTEKLRECPFCGVTPTLGVLNRDDGFSPKDGGNVVHHGDEECPAEGFYSLEVWNRRASPPPAEPVLREADLRRLAIYSVATCDINGGNKRDCPAILLEQAIAALARTPVTALDQYVDSDVDALGDLPSSWPTNEAESAALAESVEPVGLGTFARTAAILAAEPDPSLRDAVVDIVWEGERRQLGVDHTADRICALFEGAGGLHSATCPRCFLSFTCTGGCNE
jgi:hypothetical protein